MKKDNYRDYVADAFRYYALCGRPGSDQLRRLRAAAPPKMRGAIADLEAVSRLIDRLELEPEGEDQLQCLEKVYFSQPQYYPSRGELSSRVSIAAIELCMSESTVYRHLRRVRLLMAIERGLRIDDRDVAAWL